MSELEKAEYIAKLKKLQAMTDYEMAHCEADDLLTKILTDLGHGDIVKEWEEVPKYYA